MAIQLGVLARNARLDSIETVVGTDAKLYIRTGAQPANCAAADAGSLLATLTLPTDWMAAANTGVKSKAGTWSGTGSDAGDAGHFRIKDSAGTVTSIQGSITATSGGGDMTLDNINIAIGQTITISTFALTDGNA